MPIRAARNRAKLVPVESGEVGAERRHASIARPVEARDDAQERGLAAPRRPGDDVEPTTTQRGRCRRQPQHPGRAGPVASCDPIQDDGVRVAVGSNRGRERRRRRRQRRREPALRVADRLRRGSRRAEPLGDRSPVGDVDDPVGDRLDGFIVGDDEAGRALGSHELAQHRQDRLGGCAVELAGGLVGQEERRSRRQRDRERHPLLLPARELVAVGSATIREPDPLEELGHALLAFLPSDATERERQPDRLARRHVGRQRPPVVLLDDADPRTAVLVELGSRCGRQVAPEHLEASGGRAVEAADEPQQRRLARSRRADDRGHLAGLDADVEATERRDGSAGRGMDADQAAADDRVSHRHAPARCATAPRRR